MIDEEEFYKVDCNFSYPIMGAFTEYLILCYGIERYKEFYSFKKSERRIYESIWTRYRSSWEGI